MPHLRVILNPYSGRGRAAERRADVEAALARAGLPYEIVATERAGHAVELAGAAVAAGAEVVVAAGGDGLIHEVVNGIAMAAGEGSWPALGLLPMGTANDLADNLGLPRDLSAAAALIARGETRRLDVCQANDHYFMNNAGLGLESHISVLQSRMTRVRGILRYLLATLRGIMDGPSWRMRLQWDTGEYEGLVSMVSVGNCARTGGLFYTVPHADPFDGRLTFVHGYLSSRIKILRALPMTMKSGPGNYVEHPAVHEDHTVHLDVSCEPLTPMHADGEIVEQGITEVTFRVLPGRIPIYCP